MWYVGGKIRLSKDISPILQSYINENTTFIDLFCGGCNIIDKIRASTKIANDCNKYLIDMWNNLHKVNIENMDFSKEHYTYVKDNKTEFPDWYVGLVGFHYSYGGKFFGGYARSRYSDHIERSVNKTLIQYSKLEDVTFTNFDYKEYSNVSNCVIYCDPPYKSSTQETTRYRVHFDHDEFWDWVRKMSDKNVVIVSELQAPDDFECIWEKQHNSNMSYSSESKTSEKLFMLSE